MSSTNKDDIAEVEKDWYNTYSAHQDFFANTKTKEPSLQEEEEEDVIDQIFDKLQTTTPDKNLIMSWFWAGYYQGEANTKLKYEAIIQNLKQELKTKR